MIKKRVLSGIRATGRLHLGNYLGAVKGMLSLQEDPEYKTLYMVADLHTMTTPYDRKGLREATRDVLLDYLACGLDPEKSIVFVQSDVADLHAQLAFYFSTAVSVARMQHLPTYKDKVKMYPRNVTMALLNYPILMGADILIYKASKVPVGVDQEPHLEVAREVARKMNETYGTDFPEPTRFATKGEYVPSLTGEGKMSKSVGGSYIQLTDDLATIKERLSKVPTDSGKGEIRAQNAKRKTQKHISKLKAYISQGSASRGVESLMILVELFQGKGKREAYENQYQGEGIRYRELKEDLAATIFRELDPIQKKRSELEKDRGFIDRVIREGARRAREIASETVDEVRKSMGLG